MSVFKFKQFDVQQRDSAMKVGTDAMVLGALINVQGKDNGLDIGAGTGVLSLMVAQNNSLINITAVELDEPSFEECALNFQQSVWKDRLRVVNADFINFDSSDKYDLIFSNPPYYQTKLPGKDKRLSAAKHEASLPMRSIVTGSRRLLSEKGEIWLIVPFADHERWVDEFNANDLWCNRLISISGKIGEKPNRAVLSFSFKNIQYLNNKLAVRDVEGNYTDEYKKLTKDFHFNKL